MEFGQTAKTSPVSSVAVVARSDVIATPGSVSVDLAPEKTVQSVKAGEPVKIDIRADERQAQRQVATEYQQQLQLRDVIERRIVIDPRTRSVVMQEKNTETGETVQTIPDETTLKLRLFARALADRARESSGATARYVERTA